MAFFVNIFKFQKKRKEKEKKEKEKEKKEKEKKEKENKNIVNIITSLFCKKGQNLQHIQHHLFQTYKIN